MTKESTLHNPVRSWILQSFPLAFIYKTNDRSTAGIPDIMATCNGQTIGIELKIGHVLTPLQEVTLERINRSGGVGLVLKKDKVGYVDSFSLEDQQFDGNHYQWRKTPLKEILYEINSREGRQGRIHS